MDTVSFPHRFCQSDPDESLYIDIYMGIVHIYTPISSSEWAEYTNLLSPDGPNINFGLSVDHHNGYLIAGANAFGMIYVASRL